MSRRCSSVLTAACRRRVILGCTHYPLGCRFFAAALGPKVEIIGQPDAVAQSLENYLERHPDYLDHPGRGTCRFLSSGWREAGLAHAENSGARRWAFETGVTVRPGPKGRSISPT